jgi:NhaP-type Na+/H+ or K+/H+ antiporter
VLLLLIFSTTLLVAVLLSARFSRTVLSAAVLFLAVGVISGAAAPHLPNAAERALLRRISDVTLVAILFTDGLHLNWRELRSAWRLPGRALLLGLPLTLAGVAWAAHALLGLAWLPALLVGAILSPTDPVFASAIVGRSEIPQRVRHLLNVESGMNDGLALPAVIILMEMVSGAPLEPARLARETLGGVALGAALGWIGGWLRSLRFFDVAPDKAPLHGAAIVLLVYVTAEWLSWNSYLAAFCAGMSLRSAYQPAASEFQALADPGTALLKVFAIFMFALMVGAMGLGDWKLNLLFGVVVLALVRVLSIVLALIGSGMPAVERLTAAWFGPRGFASVVYALMVMSSSIDDRQRLFAIVATVVLLSIGVHSSTDVPVARYFGSQLAQRTATAGRK